MVFFFLIIYVEHDSWFHHFQIILKIARTLTYILLVCVDKLNQFLQNNLYIDLLFHFFFQSFWWPKKTIRKVNERPNNSHCKETTVQLWSQPNWWTTADRFWQKRLHTETSHGIDQSIKQRGLQSIKQRSQKSSCGAQISIPYQSQPTKNIK